MNDERFLILTRDIINIIKLKYTKNVHRLDAEHDTHGVCTRSTADDWLRKSETRRTSACVCACVCFSYYYYVRVCVCVCACTCCRHLPVRFSPPHSVTPTTWSRSTTRPIVDSDVVVERSCAFDPSHPRPPSCSNTTRNIRASYNSNSAGFHFALLLLILKRSCSSRFRRTFRRRSCHVAAAAVEFVTKIRPGPDAVGGGDVWTTCRVHHHSKILYSLRSDFHRDTCY